MKTAVIYARYSCEKQTEQSIEGQLRICYQFAERNGITILDSYIDRATTGTNDCRKAFQKMLKDSSKRAWDYVIVYKLDRFSRNKYESAIHKKTLKDNGVRLLSATENIPDTPEGIILESLLEGMAEYYSAELSQKVIRGQHESRLKGDFPGGAVLYGFKVIDKKVFAHEQQAEIVQYMFSQYASGVYVKDIVAELTSKGILHRGKPFVCNTVYQMLQNEKYTGVYHYKGQEYTNIYPQIVSSELFTKVQAIAKKNKVGRHSPDVVYLLRNKLYCGYCGKTICSETGTSQTGVVKRYYKCNGKRHHNGCNKANVSKEVLEKLVIDTTYSVFATPENIDAIANEIISRQNTQKENPIITLLKSQQTEIQKSISNVMSAIEQGIITSTTKSRLTELEAQLEKISADIIKEEMNKPKVLTKTEITTFISSALKKQPKQMINLLINRITLFDDKIQITYNFTNKISPDDHQGFSFTQIFTLSRSAHGKTVITVKAS